jgi:hypothetical protein
MLALALSKLERARHLTRGITTSITIKLPPPTGGVKLRTLGTAVFPAEFPLLQN